MVSAYPAVQQDSQDPRADFGTGLINLLDPLEIFHERPTTETPTTPYMNGGYDYNYKPAVRPVKPYPAKPAYPMKPAYPAKYPAYTPKPYQQPSNLNVYLTLPLVPAAATTYKPVVLPTLAPYAVTTARPYSAPQGGVPVPQAVANPLASSIDALLPNLPAGISSLLPRP